MFASISVKRLNSVTLPPSGTLTKTSISPVNRNPPNQQVSVFYLSFRLSSLNCFGSEAMETMTRSEFLAPIRFQDIES